MAKLSSMKKRNNTESMTKIDVKQELGEELKVAGYSLIKGNDSHLFYMDKNGSPLLLKANAGVATIKEYKSLLQNIIKKQAEFSTLDSAPEIAIPISSSIDNGFMM